MQKYYYRWKDSDCNGVNPEWIRMSGKEYHDFCRSPESKGRYFMRFGNRICKEADIVVMETTAEEYQKWESEHRHERYLDRCMVGYSTVDLQERTDSPENLVYEETIADESVNIEEEYFHKKKQELIKELFLNLTDEDMALIDMLYKKNKGKSEREIAADNDIPKTTLNRRKIELRKKIEKFLGQNGF